MKAKASASLARVNWSWKDNRPHYDCALSLSPDERHHLATLVSRFQAGQKGWHRGAAAALSRLTRPLYETLDYLGATTTEKRNRAVRNIAVCLLIRAMDRWQIAYWGFTSQQWYELIGKDYYAYIARHGSTGNARHQIIALAYLLCDFDDLWSIGRLSWPRMAEKIFGSNAFADSHQSVITELLSRGYTETGNVVAIKCAVASVFLKARTCNLYKIRRETLLELHQNAKAKITRRGLVLLSEVLCRAGIIPQSISRIHRAAYPEIQHKTVIVGVSPAWAEMAERWFNTSPLQHASRVSVLYGVLRAGRWFACISPEAADPGDWTRQTCIEYISHVLQWSVGDYSTPRASVAPLIGKPLSAKTRECLLKNLRTFFNDLHEWEWLPYRFDASRALATPASVRRLIGPDPRIVNDDIWAKLLWAGLNISDDDWRKKHQIAALADAVAYPLAMIKALALVWLFSGLRNDEIRRLRLGCIRWENSVQTEPDKASQKTCLLDVPVNKTNVAFTKPVDAVLGMAVDAWEKARPPQPSFVDMKTGESVQLLFAYRGRRLGAGFINDSLIPMLCEKAGVPQSDARGRITSHRARATIASQLYNAKQPFSLFELQEWLGHNSPESTRHYAKITPTRLVKSFADAGYYERNLRSIAVLIDRDVVESGLAGSEPWKYYDLGHGLCSYDFFDQCPHRMACARCDFYVPKASTKNQLLEAKHNLLRMTQTITLTDEERTALDEDVVLYENLLDRLAQIPTPDSEPGAEAVSNTGSQTRQDP
jgi:integrase